MKGRHILRGKPLDDDCKKAHVTSHEYGMEDDRVFCYGLVDCHYDALFDKCVKCGAFVDNAKPLKEVKQ